ncbi:hypothetical protein ACTXT7_011913 [Hymenolepis weldensis]
MMNPSYGQITKATRFKDFPKCEMQNYYLNYSSLILNPNVVVAAFRPRALFASTLLPSTSMSQKQIRRTTHL